jgi:hypothetical protein
MISESSSGSTQASSRPASLFTAEDVAAILREHGWLGHQGDARAAMTPELESWLADAAALLGSHAAGRDALADLLHLVFEYDARAILASAESQTVLSREGSREILRFLAHEVLSSAELDSDRFKAIVGALKEKMRFRGLRFFTPIRLALAGRTGEGELDRVILLLDRAARLPFNISVKSTRQRMLEFCAALE